MGYLRTRPRLRAALYAFSAASIVIALFSSGSHSARAQEQNLSYEEEAPRIVSLVVRRLESAVLRYEVTADRIESRLEKLEAEGFSVDGAKRSLAATRVRLEAVASKTSSILPAFQSSRSTQGDPAAVRLASEAVREHLTALKEIRGAYLGILASLQSLIENN